MIDELCPHNDTLHDSAQQLQLQSQADTNPLEDEPLEPQPLSQDIWDDAVQENFRSPSLATYDGKMDHWEHVIAISNQMAVIASSESLKCKLMDGMLKDIVMRWYMSLPRLSVSSYLDLTKKLAQHFSAIRRRRCPLPLCSRSGRVTRSPSGSTLPDSTKKPPRYLTLIKSCSLVPSSTDSGHTVQRVAGSKARVQHGRDHNPSGMLHQMKRQ